MANQPQSPSPGNPQQQPEPPTPQQPEPCFQVRDRSSDNTYCLTNAEFTELVEANTESFRNLDREYETRALGSPNWARDSVNAYKAYAHLSLIGRNSVAAGKGVTLGFVDSGLHLDHPEFVVQGEESTVFQHIDSTFESSFERSHGTQVVGAAAGLHTGIAPGVDIIMFGSRNPDPSESDFVSFSEDSWFQIFDSESDILNLSFGYPATSTDNLSTLSDGVTASVFKDEITAYLRVSESKRPIIVQSAGNQSQTHPNINSFWGLDPDVPFVTVVSVDRQGRISTFSNRCGVAADFCIAAPGEDLTLPSYDTSGFVLGFYETVDGTSFAAPIVSGGLAVMKQLFRDNLSDRQLVDRLFATAKDDGIHATSAIYGHGLMDLGAATNPWGIPEFMSTLPGRSSATITSSFMTLGAPLGDGLSNALASQEIAAFDGLGAPFWFQASDFTVPASGSSVAARLQRFLTPIPLRSLPDTWQFDFQEDASALETGHLALTDGASRFSMDGPQGVAATVFQKPGDLEGLTLAWNPNAFSALTLEAGYLNEQQSLLGSQAKGAFGSLSGETLFLSAGLNATAGRWQLAAQGEIGQVNPSLGHSQLIDAASSLSTSAFRLQATRPFANGSALSFSLSQPLRVESGSVAFSLPTGRTQDGVVLHQALSAPLAPSGRQLDLTAKLEVPWLGGDLSLGATRSSQPRHQLTAAPEWTIFTGYRSTW